MNMRFYTAILTILTITTTSAQCAVSIPIVRPIAAYPDYVCYPELSWCSHYQDEPQKISYTKQEHLGSRQNFAEDFTLIDSDKMAQKLIETQTNDASSKGLWNKIKLIAHRLFTRQNVS